MARFFAKVLAAANVVSLVTMPLHTYLSPEIDSTKSRMSALRAADTTDLPVSKPVMSVESDNSQTMAAAVNVAVHVDAPVTVTVVALAYRESGVSPELHVQREKR